MSGWGASVSGIESAGFEARCPAGPAVVSGCPLHAVAGSIEPAPDESWFDTAHFPRRSSTTTCRGYLSEVNSQLTIIWVYPGFPIRLGALPGFVVGDRMWKALWKLVENEQRFPRRGGRVLCVHGAVSFHRARPCGRPVCRPGRHEGSLEPYRQNCDESGLQISPPGPLRRHDLPDRGFLHRF